MSHGPSKREDFFRSRSTLGLYIEPGDTRKRLGGPLVHFVGALHLGTLWGGPNA